MIRFSCPGCGATYSVDDSKGGKSGKCPKCQSQFQIPPAESAPPPLPSSSDASGTVEIDPCPTCQTRLSVSASDLGSDVECPGCKTIFKAVKPGSAAVSAPAPRKTEEKPARRRDDDDEEEERPSKRKRVDDEDEDRPSKRKRVDDDDDRPSRRKSRRDDDDDDDDRPSRRRRGSRGSYEPHRGVMILVLGILGLVGCGIFTAIPAWVMGSGDLKKIDAGTMDPEGRQLTQIGKILGMVSVILTCLVVMFYCVIFVLAMAAGGAK